ncbi:LuxR C-terminal-related transcriptional regulator [Nonomuraea sp. NPDC050394]|uniref:helix-turn-helix transcriptional regulator n=1 Tax=Nonomuraea sp. NPDC050394 TaxID=3364363 RepID=UPI0037BCEA41
MNESAAWVRVRALAAKAPVTLLVGGAKGMGKTWLAGRIMAESQAAVRVAVGCGGLPSEHYVVTRELIAGLCEGETARERRALAAIERDGVYDVCRAVRELLRSAGETVLLVVEDVDRADARSRQVLRYLATRLPRGVALVMTYSPGEQPPLGAPLAPAAGGSGVHRVELRPMPVAEIAKFAGRPPGRWALDLHELTGGVPLYVAEVLAGPAGEIPGTVMELVRERLAGVDPYTRKVVWAAAIAGSAGAQLLPARIVRPAVVARICGVAVGEVEPALLDGVRAGLLTCREGGTFAFAPPLLGQAVAEGIPVARRCELHAAAAEALREHDSGAQPEELIHHLKAAGQLATAATYAQKAADQAVQAGDTARAVHVLRVLLSEPELPGRARRELAAKLGTLAITGLRCEETIALLRAILADPLLPQGLRGELRLNLGLVMMNQAGDAAGRGELARAARELRRRPALAARAMSALALPYGAAIPLHEHLWWLEEAERTVPERGDAALLTGVGVNRAGALMQIGDHRAWAAAWELPENGRTPAERLQLARGYCNLAGPAMALGYPNASAQYLSRAEELAAHAGPSYPKARIAEVRLYHRWATGRRQGLAESAHRHLTANAGSPAATANASLVLGHLALSRGEWEEAAQFLGGPGLDGSIGWYGIEFVLGTAGRVRLATARGQWPAELDQALELFRAKGVWTWAGELVDAAIEAMVRQGEQDRASALLEEFAADVSARDCPFAHAVALHGSAVLEQDPESLARAAAALAAVSRPYEQARALESAGRCSLPEGIGQVAEAARLFTALGATWDAARCARALREHGGSAEPRRGRRGYGTQLSPREQQVARLIALGRTNKQIADVLFLSPRTVEQHVSRVLRKLGTTSRAEVSLE